MAEDSEDLSEVFEEDEDVSIKKVYETRPIMSLSKKLEQKKLEDDPDIDIQDDDDSKGEEESEEPEEPAEPSEPQESAEQQEPVEVAERASKPVHSPPKKEHGLSFQEREEEHMRSIKRKNELMEEMLKAEREKECTFQPEMREKGGDGVSFENFLRKQDEHLKRKEQFYVDRSKEKEVNQESTMRDKPSINDSSRVMAKGSTSERLLAKKSKLTTQSPAREKAEERAGMKLTPPSFTPSITEKAQGIKRDGKVEETLYNDALRRKNKAPSPSTVVEDSKRCNTMDEAYLMRKYEREFSACAAEIGKDVLNYDDFCKFLKLFGCVVSASDQELLPELWKYLEGDSRNGVTKPNLNLTLKAILHLPTGTTAGSIGPSGPAGTEAQFTAEGNLQLGEKQCAFLHSQFFSFHVNKQCSAGNGSGDKGVEYSFRPQINKKTEELAAAARLKQGESLSVEDKLLQQHRKYEDWKNEQKRQWEEEEMKQKCTFKPKITELDPKMCPLGLDAQKAMLEKEQSKDKCLELFEMSKLPKKKPQPEQPRPEEGKAKEVEKRLEAEQQRTKKTKVKLNERSVDSAVNRLTKARKEKEMLQAMKEKGFTYAGSKDGEAKINDAVDIHEAQTIEVAHQEDITWIIDQQRTSV